MATLEQPPVAASPEEAVITNGRWAGYARLLHAQLIIEDLVRLGILVQMQRAEARDHYALNGLPMPMKGGPTVLKLEYSLTHYGVNFIRAVTTKITAPDP